MDIAKQIVTEDGDEAWIQDLDQEPHYHKGQTSGETHVDAYYAKNVGGTVSVEKYHSDDA